MNFCLTFPNSPFHSKFRSILPTSLQNKLEMVNNKSKEKEKESDRDSNDKKRRKSDCSIGKMPKEDVYAVRKLFVYITFICEISKQNLRSKIIHSICRSAILVNRHFKAYRKVTSKKLINLVPPLIEQWIEIPGIGDLGDDANFILNQIGSRHVDRTILANRNSCKNLMKV